MIGLDAAYNGSPNLRCQRAGTEMGDVCGGVTSQSNCRSTLADNMIVIVSPVLI